MIISVYFVLILGLAIGLILDWQTGIDYPQTWLWLNYAIMSTLLYWLLAQLQVMHQRRSFKIIVIFAGIILVPAFIVIHYFVLLGNSAITLDTHGDLALILPLFISVVLIVTYPSFILLLRRKQELLSEKRYWQLRLFSFGYIVVTATVMIAMYSLNNYGTISLYLSKRSAEMLQKENMDLGFTLEKSSDGNFELLTVEGNITTPTGIIISTYPASLNRTNTLLFSPSKQYVIYDDWSERDQLSRLNLAKTDGTDIEHGPGQRIEKIDLKLAQWENSELRIYYCEQRQNSRPEKNGIYQSTITIKSLTGQSDKLDMKSWSYQKQLSNCPYVNSTVTIEHTL